jgi:hypothetical protein
VEAVVLTRAHLAWLLASIAATAAYLYLRRAGMPISIGGITITVINLGEIGAVLLAGAAAYLFRKRAFIGAAGHLDTWLWAHIYLSLLGLLLVWHHSRGRFSPSERLANVAMLLFFAAAVAGVLTRLLYVAVPRLLARLPDYDPPGVLQERVGVLERQAASYAALKSSAFQAAYEQALAQAVPARPQVTRARTGLPPAELDDFDRVLRLLEARHTLRRTLRRRRLYRGILVTSWRLHMGLSLMALGLMVLHILDAVLLRHRLS